MNVPLAEASVPGYVGNPFIEALGPLLSDEEMFRRLACKPAMRNR